MSESYWNIFHGSLYCSIKTLLNVFGIPVLKGAGDNVLPTRGMVDLECKVGQMKVTTRKIVSCVEMFRVKNGTEWSLPASLHLFNSDPPLRPNAHPQSTYVYAPRRKTTSQVSWRLRKEETSTFAPSRQAFYFCWDVPLQGFKPLFKLGPSHAPTS